MDQILIDYLQFRFTLRVERDNFKNNTFTENQPSAVNFPDDLPYRAIRAL